MFKGDEVVSRTIYVNRLFLSTATSLMDKTGKNCAKLIVKLLNHHKVLGSSGQDRIRSPFQPRGNQLLLP